YGSYKHVWYACCHDSSKHHPDSLWHSDRNRCRFVVDCGCSTRHINCIWIYLVNTCLGEIKARSSTCNTYKTPLSRNNSFVKKYLADATDHYHGHWGNLRMDSNSY